jgi:hypothetical protein
MIERHHLFDVFQIVRFYAIMQLLLANVGKPLTCIRLCFDRRATRFRSGRLFCGHVRISRWIVILKSNATLYKNTRKELTAIRLVSYFTLYPFLSNLLSSRILNHWINHTTHDYPHPISSLSKLTPALQNRLLANKFWPAQPIQQLR